ncbi:unnamed protein product, partial [Ceratitis capitata]
ILMRLNTTTTDGLCAALRLPGDILRLPRNHLSRNGGNSNLAGNEAAAAAAAKAQKKRDNNLLRSLPRANSCAGRRRSGSGPGLRSVRTYFKCHAAYNM